MISSDIQIKLAIVSTKLVGQWCPLEAIAENLRDYYGVHLSSRQIAAVYAYWRRCGFSTEMADNEFGGIEKKKQTKNDAGFSRVSSVYKTDAKTIKRLLDFLYKRQLLNKKSLR